MKLKFGLACGSLLVLALCVGKAQAVPGEGERARVARTTVMDGTAENLSAGSTLLRAVGDSRYGVSDDLELRSTLWLWLLLSPNIEIRQLLYAWPTYLSASFDYGLAFPSGSARLLKGYLFPTNEVTGNNPGLALIPHAGVNLTVPVRGVSVGGMRHGGSNGRNSGWLTSSLSVHVRLPLSGEMPVALATYAPLELAYAPYTTGYRTSASITYKSQVSKRSILDLSVLADRTGERNGGELSPLFLGMRVNMRFNVTEHMGLLFGATIYNYDQGATRVHTEQERGVATRERVRQTDLYPSLDLSWLL